MKLFCLTFLVLMTRTRSEYIVERSTVDDSLLFNNDFQNSTTCNIYNAVVKSNNSCSCPSKTTFFSLNGKASCMSGSMFTGCLVVAKNSPLLIPVVQLNVTQQLDLLTTFQCNYYPSQISLRRWKNGEGFYDVSGASSLFIKLTHIGTQYQYTLLIHSTSFSQEFAGALLQLNMNLCGLLTCFMFKIEGEDKWSLSEKLVYSSSITTTAQTSKLPSVFTSINIYTSLLSGLSSISQFPSIEAAVSAQLPDTFFLSMKTDSTPMTSFFSKSVSFIGVSSQYPYISKQASEEFGNTFSLSETRSIASNDPSLINYSTPTPSEILTSLYITKSITKSPIIMPSSKNIWNFSISSLNVLNSDLNIFSILNSTSIKVSTVETMSVTMELLNSNGRKKRNAIGIPVGIAVGVFVIGSFVVLIAILLRRRHYKSSGKLQIA
ncbi:uncharacterized protein LOC100196984 isoform X4 [Hydra vulgaris]|uniref:uncharacterized protein LOC100196984 isoform X4 n=1 Tax=Hydra vulgaris TaxID=6087 RepID=UPI001F5FF2CB|nr:uncharacterized protein LOC100196984 isoform X3 [Hydra vulgaris]